MRIPKGGIAFFDSGIGGLTVLSACEKYFQGGVFYYYGDNTHAPYGNLPQKKIRRYVLRAFRKFRRLKVSAAVIACNTATAVCVEELRKKYSFPIVGAEPAIFSAAAKGGEVFVLATRATCESERFRRLCARAERLFPEANVRAVPCEKLAGEIERNLLNKEYDYSAFLPYGRPHSVVLGCTHYIYIKERIQAYYACETYDGNEGMARRLYSLLKKREKDRDGRPPNTDICPPLGSVTTFDSEISQNTRKNGMKGSIEGKNPEKATKKEKKLRIFFIGKEKKCNKLTRKQMFACEVGTKK